MTDTAAPRCPWCSAVLERADAATCPSCGAHLLEPTGFSVPGVTAIDPEALARRHAELHAPSGIVGMLSRGDDSGAPSEDELPALAPPDEAVRREMLRMELEAKLATLTAEAHAVAAERGIPLDELEASAGDAERAGDEPRRASDLDDDPAAGPAGPAGASGAPPTP